MKKDIQIPESSGVYIAAMYDWNEEFESYDWNIYVLNDKNEALEMVLIISSGQDGDRKTSIMRHGIGVVAAKEAAKVELLNPQLLSFENKFAVTYYFQNQLFEKTFVFAPNSIQKEFRTQLPAVHQLGVLAK
ncbi:MAG: hypothetical protein OIF50_15570 [Flavobacteriaceae bacterium]|nr:hypothetical protein [Flavobacteriaceae bacterium]